MWKLLKFSLQCHLSKRNQPKEKVRILDSSTCMVVYVSLSTYLWVNDYIFRFPKYRKAEEEKTKLAFSIVAHDQLGLLEILLHLIFRPYHAYCIYIASNVAKIYRKSVRQMINCYKDIYPDTNIFMAVNANAVNWGNWSLFQADLICMKQLLELKSQ